MWKTQDLIALLYRKGLVTYSILVEYNKQFKAIPLKSNSNLRYELDSSL